MCLLHACESTHACPCAECICALFKLVCVHVCLCTSRGVYTVRTHAPECAESWVVCARL